MAAAIPVKVGRVCGFGEHLDTKKVESLQFWERYTKTSDKCGAGAYGCVFSARRNSDGKLVAVKQMLRSKTEGTTAAAVREIMVLKKVEKGLERRNSFKHLILLLEVDCDESATYIVLEQATTDLSKFMRCPDSGKARPVPAPLIKHFMLQIFLALNFLNEMGFVHRDLKPPNVVQTVTYRAPEVFLGMNTAGFVLDYKSLIVGHDSTGCRSDDDDDDDDDEWDCRETGDAIGSAIYSSAMDIWSAGCIFAEMINGVILFDGETIASRR
ncbi:Cyclin-dependent kinase 3 [Entophlyctis luteolus]|nr:Cyclin-dependent kinase 3 [Entophlyctis luteolus]KAJ3393621.1 Cyclin-dependent kinase 3 [Entophlyctis sp. JEL0112]